MRFRLRKNPYKDVLDQSAAQLRPSEETCQKILGSVMVAAGVTGAVTFAAASAKVSALAKAALYKMIGAAAAVTTGVVAVSTASVLVLSPPVIQEIYEENAGWTSSSIVVATGSGAATKTVTIIPKEGAPIPAQRVRSGWYEAQVDQNGVYQIEVTGQSGQIARGDIAVSQIDDQFPYMEEYTLTEDTVTLRLADDRSGVDWNTVYALDAGGTVVNPLSVDGETGLVVFPLTEEGLSVYAEDLAGNMGVTIVSVL